MICSEVLGDMGFATMDLPLNGSLNFHCDDFRHLRFEL